MSGLRVALSGSAGTGKSTLGRLLARELGLPFLEEGMRARLEAGLDLHALDARGWPALIEELWIEQREREERAAGGFVCDRSSVDYAAFWLHYDLFADAAETERWIERSLAEAERYDRILPFPWGVLPLEDDGVRTTNRWVQFRFQALLEALLERSPAAPRVLRVPATPSLEERLAAVLPVLLRGGHRAQG